jgi:hypothetical protein
MKETCHYVEQTGVRFFKQKIEDTLFYTVKANHILEVFLNPLNEREMKVDVNLRNFDLEELDLFERKMYEDFIQSMSKEEALQIIINTVEGDYSQLSESLAEIAELQDEETN